MEECSTVRAPKLTTPPLDHAERLAFGWDLIVAEHARIVRFVAEMGRLGWEIG